MDDQPLAVRMRGIHKGFYGVPVLTDVDFEVRRGEVHALAGGNGAGKSTLMKMLQGVYPLDQGEIFVDGRPVHFSSIHDARAAGIGMVFQEFSLVPTLTVAQNIYLTTEPLGTGGLIKDREASRRAREVFRVADRITVLRDGRTLFTTALSDVTPEEIVEGIVGREIEGGSLSWQERTLPEEPVPLLEARDLRAGQRVRNVSFRLHAGEILGLAGLMGSGRTELARCLFGVDRLEDGQVLLRGQPVDLSSPRKATAAGIALIPEDRREQALVLEHSVRDNLLLPLLGRIERGAFLSDRAGNALAHSLIQRFAVKVANPNRPVRLLSGGNQQKVVIAKWLGIEPEVLIMDEPTAGVDIGTKSEILDVIRGLADSGKGIILISSELPELLAVSDRVLVLRHGTVAQELHRRDIPDEESLQLAVQGV